MEIKNYEKELADWMKAVAEKSGRKIQESEVFLSLVSKNFLENPQCALELGLAILMDKPILVLAEEHLMLPENLKKIAKIVSRFDPEKPDTIHEAVKTMSHEFNKAELS